MKRDRSSKKIRRFGIETSPIKRVLHELVKRSLFLENLHVCCMKNPFGSLYTAIFECIDEIIKGHVVPPLFRGKSKPGNARLHTLTRARRSESLSHSCQRFKSTSFSLRVTFLGGIFLPLRPLDIVTFFPFFDAFPFTVARFRAPSGFPVSYTLRARFALSATHVLTTDRISEGSMIVLF